MKLETDFWRVGLRGNPHRGVNRALSMENLYGTADHLLFRSMDEANAVVVALDAAGYRAFVVRPKPSEPAPSATDEVTAAASLGPESGVR
jgi:hypothetical protein